MEERQEGGENAAVIQTGITERQNKIHVVRN